MCGEVTFYTKSTHSFTGWIKNSLSVFVEHQIIVTASSINLTFEVMCAASFGKSVLVQYLKEFGIYAIT